ncbi:hypothetical protein [Streptomyces sp. NPDC059909]|uniref:hypothetical protein n=1 Tax=Streptomyces sp. NPDC059909 TaxID=3346998 RepID=UPI00366634BC
MSARLRPTPPATDMQGLAQRIRALIGIEAQHEWVSVPLGGRLFDVVITASGTLGRAAVARMDDIQLGICGPVIEDPEQSLLFWLVPSGTSAGWQPDLYSVAFGAPWVLPLPRLSRRKPPGLHWLRECRSDRLVPPLQLRRLLGQGSLAPLPVAATGPPLQTSMPAGG